MSTYQSYFLNKLTFNRTTQLPYRLQEEILLSLSDSNQLAEADLHRLAPNWLHAEELAVLEKRKHIAAQREFLLSRVLIKTAIAKFGNLSYTDLSVLFDTTDTCLKVFYRDQPLPVQVCLSHSHGYVLVAISTKTACLGVDLEQYQTRRPVEKLAAHFYHADELQLIRKNGTDSFYRIWTLKEALAKASKRPIAQLLRDNVFEQLRDLSCISGTYQGFDISLIADTLPKQIEIQVVEANELFKKSCLHPIASD